jgi:hypothetical protein
MTKLLSKPARIVVNNRPSLGAGAQKGSMRGDVWTPGRDAAGVVNQASWNIVPANRWIEVDSTNLSKLDTLVKSAIPGWRDHGSGGADWSGVTGSWNGTAFDDLGLRAWYMAAGGHNDSSNNGIYRFDAYKMDWAIEQLPSDSNKWSASYIAHTGTTSFSTCLDSSAAGLQQDELVWDNPTVTPGADRGPLGMPTSRHTYSMIGYARRTNELIMACRRLWVYSLDIGQYVVKTNFPTPQGYMTNDILAVDDETGRTFWNGVGDGGAGYGNGYDLVSRRFTGVALPGGGYDFFSAADTKFGSIVTVFNVPDSPTGSYPKPAQYFQFDTSAARTVTSQRTAQLGTGISPSEFDSGNDGPGMVAVPPLNQFWFLAKQSSSTYPGAKFKWYMLDPTTTPWTIKNINFANQPPVPKGGNELIRRRMHWMPALNAVIFFGSGPENAHIYKVA